MTEIKCGNCKHYVEKNNGVGFCCYNLLFLTHVRSIDWCDCYEAKYRKEQ